MDATRVGEASNPGPLGETEDHTAVLSGNDAAGFDDPDFVFDPCWGNSMEGEAVDCLDGTTDLWGMHDESNDSDEFGDLADLSELTADPWGAADEFDDRLSNGSQNDHADDDCLPSDVGTATLPLVSWCPLATTGSATASLKTGGKSRQLWASEEVSPKRRERLPPVPLPRRPLATAS